MNMAQNNQNKKPRVKIPVAYKLKIVQFAIANSNRKASESFGVSRSKVKNWRKHKAQLEEVIGKRFRFRASNYSTSGNEVTEALTYEFIIEQREKGVCLSKKDIQRKALQIHRDRATDPIEYDSFQASDGWFRGFLRRKSLSYRRVTSQVT